MPAYIDSKTRPPGRSKEDAYEGVFAAAGAAGFGGHLAGMGLSGGEFRPKPLTGPFSFQYNSPAKGLQPTKAAGHTASGGFLV